MRQSQTQRQGGGAAVGVGVPVPTISVAPAIDSSAGNSVGDAWTVDDGTWTGGPILEYAYRWTRDAAVISGETTAGYTLTSPDDPGAEVDAEVRARNAGGWSAWVSATGEETVRPYWTAAPVVTGDNWAGGAGLTTTTGTVLGATSAPAEWHVGGVGTGDTGATYAPVPGDVGSDADYRVDATNPGGVTPQASNAVPIDPVFGLGPDALGNGMSAATVSLPAAATLVWVGYVTARDSIGWLTQATYDVSNASARRGLALRTVSGAPGALAFGTSGVVAVASGTLAGLDTGSLCVLVATVTGSGGTLSLTSGLAGGTPARVTAAVSGSIAHASAVPGMWQAIGGGSNARTAGRGEMYALGTSLSDAAADALVTADGTAAGALAAIRALAAHGSILVSGYPDPGVEEGDTLVAGTVDGGTWTLVDPNIYAGGLNVSV